MQNSNLAYALGGPDTKIGNIRETFFLNQMRTLGDVFASDSVDFMYEKYHFEIGGKRKGQKQGQCLENTIIVKYDLEFGLGNIVPIW